MNMANGLTGKTALDVEGCFLGNTQMDLCGDKSICTMEQILGDYLGQLIKQVAILNADFTICVCTESSSAHFIRLPNNLNEKCDTELGWNKT